MNIHSAIAFPFWNPVLRCCRFLCRRAIQHPSLEAFLYRPSSSSHRSQKRACGSQGRAAQLHEREREGHFVTCPHISLFNMVDFCTQIPLRVADYIHTNSICTQRTFQYRPLHHSRSIISTQIHSYCTLSFCATKLHLYTGVLNINVVYVCVCMQVLVVLAKTVDVCSVAFTEDHKQEVLVRARSSVLIPYTVIPLQAGDLPLQVTAVSRSFIGQDAIRKNLRVVVKLDLGILLLKLVCIWEMALICSQYYVWVVKMHKTVLGVWLQVEGIQKLDVRSFVLNPAEKGDSGETTSCCLNLMSRSN